PTSTRDESPGWSRPTSRRGRTSGASRRGSIPPPESSRRRIRPSAESGSASQPFLDGLADEVLQALQVERGMNANRSQQGHRDPRLEYVEFGRRHRRRRRVRLGSSSSLRYHLLLSSEQFVEP